MASIALGSTVTTDLIEIEPNKQTGYYIEADKSQ